MPKLILLIEDEPIYLKGHITALEEVGYIVDVSNNARSATARLQELPSPSLIILDIIMPFSQENVGPNNGMKIGIELLERIRGELAFNGPVLILTVVANREEHERINRIERRFGHEANIKVKPILPSELISEIELQLH